jgi:predicted DNA-binding transcriptional regulator AlpA
MYNTPTALTTDPANSVGASSIAEFCKRHGISIAMFYKLAKTGKAPRLMHVGVRRLVSDEDAAAWRRMMAEASPQQVTTA